MFTSARTWRASLAMWLGITSVVLLVLPVACAAVFSGGHVFRALVIVAPGALPLGLVGWATARRVWNASAPDEMSTSERRMLRCGIVCGLTGALGSVAASAVLWRWWYAMLIDAG